MKKKTIHFSLFALATVILFSCSKNEVAEKPTEQPVEISKQMEFPAQLKNNDHLEKVDMAGYDYVSAKDMHLSDGCGDAVEARGKDEAAAFECCKIHSLTYYGPPSWPAQVVHQISGPNVFEATDWFLRFTLIDNTTGDVVFDFFTNDNSYDLRKKCTDSYPGAVFLGSVGILCPNDFTYTLGRYYEWLDSDILYECCSKSLDVTLPVDPDAPACG